LGPNSRASCFLCKNFHEKCPSEFGFLRVRQQQGRGLKRSQIIGIRQNKWMTQFLAKALKVELKEHK
jgi:hypothetical protein